VTSQQKIPGKNAGAARRQVSAAVSIRLRSQVMPSRGKPGKDDWSKRQLVQHNLHWPCNGSRAVSKYAHVTMGLVVDIWKAEN